MRRREFTIGVLLVARALPAQAQKPAKRRLAILHPAIPAAKITEDIFWRGFFADLGRLGPQLGQDFRFWTQGGHHVATT
jgi:hypothetical protein